MRRRCVLVAAVLVVAACAQPATSPDAGTTTPPATAIAHASSVEVTEAPSPAVTESVAATSEPTEPVGGTAPPAATPGPRVTAPPGPKATPKPTPHGTPKPTPEPAGYILVQVSINPVAEGADELLYTETSGVPVDATCTLRVVYPDAGTITYQQTLVAQWSFKIPSNAGVGTAQYSAKCVSPSFGGDWWLSTSGDPTFQVIAAP